MTKDTAPSSIEEAREARKFAQFLEQLPEQLEVEASTRERLASIRQSALASCEQQPKRQMWAPRAVAASLVIALGWLSLDLGTPTEQIPEVALISGLEDPDVDLELIEDLEFYEWLSELES